MKFENSVGEGWQPIVSKAVIDILEHGGTIRQIKEKFGQLRLYCSGPSVCQQIAIQAEHDCDGICEFCGKPGTIQNLTKYWIKTMCPECYAQKHS